MSLPLRERSLETGCGMALSSLLLNQQLADITATDYHPEVEFFLERNTMLNKGRLIPFERVDWAAETNTLGQFDLSIGSDLLYEDQHIKQLAGFIEKCAKPTCEVILIDSGRGRKNKLGLQMGGYGFSSSQSKPIHTDYLERPFKGAYFEVLAG